MTWGYQRILAGDYPRRENDRDASLSDDREGGRRRITAGLQPFPGSAGRLLRKRGDGASGMGDWVGSGASRVRDWMGGGGGGSRPNGSADDTEE